MVSDCLEKIVLYDNHIRSASYKLDPETLEYAVNVVIDEKKVAYDEKGKSAVAPMNDYIELGLLNADKKQVASQTIKLHTGENIIHFSATRRPAYLFLNPDFDLPEKEYNKSLRMVAVTKL